MAIGTLVLMAAVVVASAWLRLGLPRMACAEGPRCVVDATQAGPAAVEAVPGRTLARIVHRSAASMVLLLVLVMLWLARLQAHARGLLAALALLALSLAALGALARGSRAPMVMLGNLLGGFAMLGLAWALVRRLHVAVPAVSSSLRRVARVGVAAWFVQAALGALAGAAPRPWAAPAVWHLVVAVVALSVAGVAMAMRWRQGSSREGAVLAIAIAVQIVLGGAVLLGLPAPAPALVMVHSSAAALGLALLCGLAAAPRASDLAPSSPVGSTPGGAVRGA